MSTLADSRRARRRDRFAGSAGKDKTMADNIAITLPGVCAADFDGNGALDMFDFLAFQNAFVARDPAADSHGDGLFDLFDFLGFVNAFNAGC
jgi:hypothetical protein